MDNKRKKIFLMGWSVDPSLGLIDVAKNIRSETGDIVYWTWFGSDTDKKSAEKDFPNVIWQRHEDAISGIPADKFRTADFFPPGEELIAKMSGAESAALSMMNKKFHDIGVVERKQIYFDMLRYWHGVFSELKPDAVIYSDIPHTVYDFVAYSLAEVMGIKNVAFERIAHFDRMLAMNDFRSGSRRLKDELNKNKGKKFDVSDLSDGIKKRYREQLTDMVPRNIQKLKKNYVGWNSVYSKIRMIAVSFTDLSFFSKAFNNIIRRFGENIKTEYESVAVAPDFDKSFVYVPLNYQPERTTNPQGGIFDNQILMVQILAASAPKDWFIYVKEHPSQYLPRGLAYFNYRYRGFYRSIAQIPNVRLVKMDTNTHELIRKSRAVATVTGTAAWEGLLRGKPAILFGFPWFKDCPGVLRVGDVPACKVAFGKIQSGFHPDEDSVLNYVASLDRAAKSSYFDRIGKELSGASKEENIRNLSELIISEIETIG